MTLILVLKVSGLKHRDYSYIHVHVDYLYLLECPL